MNRREQLICFNFDYHNALNRIKEKLLASSDKAINITAHIRYYDDFHRLMISVLKV